MSFYSTFFISISILITSSYLLNLLYKNTLSHSPTYIRQAYMIISFILIGWLAMKFGVKSVHTSVFDLRNVPIIVATMVFRDPRQVLLIGIGVAAARFGINGFTPQAMTGSMNILILALVGTGLVYLYNRRIHWSYRKKATLSLLSINIVQAAGIIAFGALPRDFYISHIMQYTVPLATLLGAFFLFIIRDFYLEQYQASELRQMNETLLHQKCELEDAKVQIEHKAQQILLSSKYKSEFMANMSHELKTPLNSIILLSQLINENEKDIYQVDDVRYADIIHSSGTQLLQMINDILDLSNLEAGKLDRVMEPIPIEDSLQQLCHFIKPIAERKGLFFSLTIAEDVPLMMITDGPRLSQILRNLLINAVKFTDKGQVSLLVTSYRQPVSLNEELIFTVKDTGVGIETDKQRLIFEAFRQGDGSIDRKYGGIGLGLSISMELAALLGGSLTLTSVKGQGSEFSLRLPIRPDMLFSPLHEPIHSAVKVHTG